MSDKTKRKEKKRHLRLRLQRAAYKSMLEYACQLERELERVRKGKK